MIKGKNVLAAMAQLDAIVRRPGSPVAKLLKSAIANAENNNNMVRENLYVKSIRVDEGVKLKRFKPKGFGRVSPLEKKTSHIELILAEKVPGLKRSATLEKKAKEKNPEQVSETEKQEMKKPLDTARGKPEVKTELGRKEGVLKGLGRRIFQRKSI